MNPIVSRYRYVNIFSRVCLSVCVYLNHEQSLTVRLAF